jgi:hypothetical protein
LAEPVRFTKSLLSINFQKKHDCRQNRNSVKKRKEKDWKEKKKKD